MKIIIRSLMIIIIGSIGWADMFDAPPRTSTATVVDAPAVHKKKKARKEPSSNLAVPSPEKGEGVPSTNSGEGGKSPGEGTTAAAAASVVKTALPSNPVVNALDEVVLDANALAPVVASPSASVPSAPPSPIGRGTATAQGEATLPTLRAWAAGMLVRSSPWDVGVSGGLAMFRVGAQTDSAPALAIRFASQSSELRALRWGLEVGGILPHDAPNSFAVASQIAGASQYSAQLSNFYEIHAAAIHALPHGNQEWAVPEIGLGVSLLHMTDSITSVTTYPWYGGTYRVSQTTQDVRWSICPLARLGFVLFPQSLLSLRFDVSYVGYANTAHSSGQTFDLGLSGVMVEEMVQVRL